MKIVKELNVPTGKILIGEGSKGKLEFLSIGDYGKEKNIKADFLGLTNEINGVPNGDIMPLEKKWVITISTQYGCSMNCTFCDVPKVGVGRNATLNDLQQQIIEGLHAFPEVLTTERLNIHFTRMGEPSWNPNVLDCAKWIYDHIDADYPCHPVVSTMMPKNNIWLKTFVHNWMRSKNRLYRGNAGLQLSINSTNEDERNKMFSNNACSLHEISEIMRGTVAVGRKITLNFALCNYEIDENVLLRYFNPETYLIKLTPMHNTASCKVNNIETKDGYDYFQPYKNVEEKLKKAGYDVIVFVPSKEEDDSKITCGNAILSQTI